MNAYKLADTIKEFVEQIKPTNNEFDEVIVQGLPNWFIEQLEETSDMLLQQVAHIAELKEKYTSSCLEIRELGRENVDLYDEIYELKAIMYTAIKVGDWKVDGACDPDSLLYGFQLRDELC